jgi:periplasmic protein TonB
MMALRNSPSEHALFDALDAAHAQRRSRALAIAIGASICFHIGLVAYLYAERMGGQAAEPSAPSPATSISFVRLPPPAPTPTRQQPLEAHPVPITHIPTTLPLQPPLTIHPLNPGRGPISGQQLTGPTLLEPPARVIEDPKWLSRPTAAEMTRFYPARDIDQNITGQASLMCGVVANGRLVDCHVIGETPAGAEFGAAALKLTPFFRMTPKTVDGAPVDGGVTKITIAFTLTGGD